MGLENPTGATITTLDPTWPTDGDPKNQGDDHLRLIKAILKSIFPGVGGNGFATPISATEAELNFVHGVTSAIQVQINTATANAATAQTTANTAATNATTAQTTANTASTNLAIEIINRTAGDVITLASAEAVDLGDPSQTWQVLTGSRLTNTQYVNNTDRPIQVIISAKTASANLQFYIGIVGSGVLIADASTGSGPSTNGFVSIIIPNGVNYYAIVTGTYIWSELR